jgi:LAS superfamily LD-carboxypeptidase LdcB
VLFASFLRGFALFPLSYLDQNDTDAPQPFCRCSDKYGDPWTKDAGRKFEMTGDTADAFRALRTAGLEEGHDISLASAYRSPERQAKLFADAVAEYGSEKAARKWVAETSEHSTGRALDFDLGIKNSSSNAKSGAFGKVASYEWLKGAAPQFGFTPYRAEPWHWSYNPKR